MSEPVESGNMRKNKTFDSVWEKIHSETPWGKYPSEEVIRFVMRNFGRRNRSDCRILDLGCGAGAVAWFLTREGFTTFAFDGAFEGVLKAKSLLAKDGYDAVICQADAGMQPYHDGSFDAVIDSAAITANTTFGIKTILDECFRILKPSGRLFSTGLFRDTTTGYGTGLSIEKSTFRQITHGPLADIGTVHFFDRAEIERLWQHAGFTGLKIDTLDRTGDGGSFHVAFFMAEAAKPPE